MSCTTLGNVLNSVSVSAKLVTSKGGDWAAVRRLEQGHYDLVLMDVQMPLVDGIEASSADPEGGRALFGGSDHRADRVRP